MNRWDLVARGLGIQRSLARSNSDLAAALARRALREAVRSSEANAGD
jgi:hypothetical protein